MARCARTDQQDKTGHMSSSKRFFKVILCSTLHGHKLKVPGKFVKKYGDELSDLVRLVVPTGGVWYVKVEKTADKTIWFGDGLHKFLKDHSIGLGYFLIFDYGGNSNFKVYIFDLTACEIEYPNTCDSVKDDDVNQLPISDQEEDEDGDHYDKNGDEDCDDSSIEVLGSSRDHQLRSRLVQSSEFVSGANKRSSVASTERLEPNLGYVTRSKKHKIQDDGGIKSTGEQDSTRRNKVYQSNARTGEITTDEEVLVSSSTNGKNSSVNWAIQGADMKLPKNPFYKITLKAYNIYKHNSLHLPTEFARLYLSSTSQFIKLQDANENEWEVYCITNEGRTCNLSKGWAKFVKAKHLMVGDVCVFEPIRINEQVKLKVKICRAIEYAANAN